MVKRENGTLSMTRAPRSLDFGYKVFVIISPIFGFDY